MKSNELSYEEAFKELENIIEKLEKNEIDLNESIEIFKKGIELYKYCNKLLSNAEGEVKILLEDTGKSLKEVDFFEEDEKNNF